jgi:hypothetical protein
MSIMDFLFGMAINESCNSNSKEREKIYIKVESMTKGWKIFLVSLAILICIGGAFIVGRGSGGGGNIERNVAFSITVNPSGSYEIAINPVDAVVTKGDPLVFTVTSTATGGFDAQINYTVGGLPAGSYTFSVNPVAPGQSTILTVNTNMLTSNSVYSCTLSSVDI